MVLAVAGKQVQWIVSSSVVDSLGLDPASAFDLAIRNTHSTIARLRHVGKPLAQSGFTLLAGAYDSSRLLMHEDWAAFAKGKKGQLLVAVPGTDVLIYGMVESSDDIKRFRELTTQAVQQAAHPLSRDVYRWRADRWETVVDDDLPEARH
jgi:hypothetical protein